MLPNNRLMRQHMQSQRPAQNVQGLFGDLQLSPTHRDDHDDGFDVSINLPHKFVIDEQASGSRPSFLPTIEFSSDDIRSPYAYSLRRSSRSCGELGIRSSSHCSERTGESKPQSSPRTTARCMDECISRLRGLAVRFKRLLKNRWLRSSRLAP